MYDCKTCSSEFKTKKKYIDHLENCLPSAETLSPTSSSSTLLRRSSSTHSLFDSDRESRSSSRSKDLDSDKYRKAKNLAKKYKEELTRCKNEYREEVEYLQSQLSTLVEEKEEAQDQVDTLSEQIFKEKEKLRTEFNKKLSDEKKKLQSVYGGKNNLHSTVEKLQEDIQKTRDEYDNTIFSLNTQHQTEVKELQDKLKQLKKSIDIEKEELARKASVLQNEKAIALAQLGRDKDLEIETVNSEKRAISNVSEMTIQTLKKDIETLKNTHQRVLVEKDMTFQLELKDKLDTIARLKDNHARNIESYNDKKEGQIKLLTSEHNKKIAELTTQYQIQITSVEREKEITVSSMRDELDRQKSRYENELVELRKRLDITRQDIDAKVQEKELEFSNSLEKTKNEQNQIKEYAENKLKRAFEEMLRDRDSTIIEIERLNHALGAQLEHYRSALDSVTKDTTGVKEQFLSNLNKQKREYETMISERDEKIKTLSDQNNKLSIKHNSVTIDHKAIVASLTSENNNVREELKKSDDKLAKLMVDHENLTGKYRDIIKKNLTELDRIREESVTALTKQRSELELQHVRKIGELSYELDQVKQELANTKDEYQEIINSQKTDLGQKLAKLEASNKEKDGQLDKLRAVCEKLNDAGSIYAPQLLTLKTQITEEIKKTTKATEIIKERDQQLISLKNLNDNLRRNIEELSTKNRELSSKPKEDISLVKNLENTIKDKKAKLHELKDEVEELRKVNQQQSTELKIYSAKEIHYNKVEEANKEKDLQLIKIRGTCEDLNRQVYNLSAKVQSANSDSIKELEKLRLIHGETLAKLTEKIEDLDDAKEDISRLEKELCVEKDRVRHLDVETGKKSEQIEQIREISSKLNSTITGLHLRIKQQEEDYKKLQAKINSHQTVDIGSQKEIESLQQEIRDLQDKHSIEIQKLVKEKQQLENMKHQVPTEDPNIIQEKLKKMRLDCLESIRKQKDEINQLKQDNIRVNRDYKMLLETSSSKEHAIEATLQEQKAIIQKLNEKIHTLEKELDIRQERIHHLEKLLDDAMAKIMANK